MRPLNLKYLSGKVDYKHIAQIKIAQKRLDMSDENYRALLERVASVKSSKDLTVGKFGQVMDEFRRLGFESTAVAEKRKQSTRDPGHVTPAQLLKMQRLWDTWKGKPDTEGLRRWLQRKWKISSPQFLDADTSRRALDALANFRTKPTINKEIN